MFEEANRHAVNSYCEVIEWNAVWFQWDWVVGTLPEGCIRVLIAYQGRVRERQPAVTFISKGHGKRLGKESPNSRPCQALSTDKSPLVLMARFCLPFITLTNKARACSSNVSLPVVCSSQGGRFGWPQPKKIHRSEETLAWVFALQLGGEKDACQANSMPLSGMKRHGSALGRRSRTNPKFD